MGRFLSPNREYIFSSIKQKHYSCIIIFSPFTLTPKSALIRMCVLNLPITRDRVFESETFDFSQVSDIFRDDFIY